MQVRVVTGAVCALVFIGLAACSPDYTAERDPYLDLSTPATVVKKPLFGNPPSEESDVMPAPDATRDQNMRMSPILQPSYAPTTMTEPSPPPNIFMPSAPTSTTTTVTTTTAPEAPMQFDPQYPMMR